MRILLQSALLATALILLLLSGCDKERIVESSEIVHETEYIEVPGDTVFVTDTVFHNTRDTLYITETETDTVEITDTVILTETVHDTVTIVEPQYDPSEHLAIGALQYYSNPMVLDFINQQFGISDGWVFYLTTYQVDLTPQSQGVYDIYGLIDYWTTDWAEFYPIEYYWRISYTGGDPADPNNWTISDPPTTSGIQPGLQVVPQNARTDRPLK